MNFLYKFFNTIKRHKIKAAVIFTIAVAYYFILPKPLFGSNYATVVFDAEGQLVGGKIAADGQWRFPEIQETPEKYKASLLAFEDAYFYYHPGFNPVSIGHALWSNIKNKTVVRGGSTLSQQVIRLQRSGKSRSYFEKFIELILATRLELGYSKEEILRLYASHAPFGGNVIGLEMASWKYFGLQPDQLSWAEAATLAVLPNAPGLIYPGKNQLHLLQKRNRLLKKLYANGVMDQMTYELSLSESLPQRAFPMPQTASHLVERIAKETPGARVTTTLKLDLQEGVNSLIAQYYNQYKDNQIFNMAVLVIEVNTRNVISYVGNTPTSLTHKKDVDIIQAPRSTGSILKPFLYAAALDNATVLPNTLLPDIPVHINGFAPQNYNMTFDGAVPAHRALARSLNVPSVLLLQEYGVNAFYQKLQQLRLQSINKFPSHYGLSLILGGAESNLWELNRAYASMASTLNHYNSTKGMYRANEYQNLNYRLDKKLDFGIDQKAATVFGASAIYKTFEAMQFVNRPEADEAWQFYDSALKLSWKTGTSFGGRDGWAIGVTPDYVVGVWVGNATGEGRPDLTGIDKAAPVLFDVFHLLPQRTVFKKPKFDLETVGVCATSGFLAGVHCPTVQQEIPKRSKKTAMCSYHKLVHTTADGAFVVNSSCYPMEQMKQSVYFILPPVQQWYYMRHSTAYKRMPPPMSGCGMDDGNSSMDFIYPKEHLKIYLTKDNYGKVQPAVFKVAHQNPDVTLFWSLDGSYLGNTRNFHEMEINASSGMHLVTVVDEEGNEIRRHFQVN